MAKKTCSNLAMTLPVNPTEVSPNVIQACLYKFQNKKKRLQVPGDEEII